MFNPKDHYEGKKQIMLVLESSALLTPVSGEYYNISRQDLGKTTLNPLKLSPKLPAKMTTKYDPKNYPKNYPPK